MILLQVYYWYTSGSFAIWKEWRAKRVVAIAMLIVPAATSVAEDHAGWLSKTGHYRVSYESQLEPIVINRIHSWLLHVETADGIPVTDAAITVQGGMPAHDHGLPTSPRMTKSAGAGDYLIEGMRFHMNGDWEIVVSIDAAGYRDEVIIPLTL